MLPDSRVFLLQVNYQKEASEQHTGMLLEMF
jgi:hypothetical protein